MREANDRGYECLVLSDCSGATDYSNHLAALKMVTMQRRSIRRRGRPLKPSSRRSPAEPHKRVICANRCIDFLCFVEPDPAPRFARLELKNLFHIAEDVDAIPWQPFRNGIDIHRLYGDGVSGPTAALIRFREKGSVPMHEHEGYEHILVLSGSREIKTALQPPVL